MPVAGRTTPLRPRRRRGFLVIVGGVEPTVTFVSQTRSRISQQTGVDATDVAFSVDVDHQAYQVRVVSSTSATVDQGTLLESGGSGTAGVQRTITITDDELIAATGIEGSNLLKIFAQANDGTWST